MTADTQRHDKSPTRINPPFRADHVGSLLRPKALLDLRYAAPEDRPSPEALRVLEDQAIRDVVSFQESIGLQSVTDGEFRRESWRSGFVSKVDGFERRPQRATVGTARDANGKTSLLADPPYAGRPLRRIREIVTDDFIFLRSLTTRTPKVTLPAPSYMHFFLGEDSFSPSAYDNSSAYFDALVAIYVEELSSLAANGCTYVQLDEVVLPALCDPTIRAAVEARGDRPEALVDSYVGIVNRIVASRPKELTIAMHFCRGNSMGRWLADGGYDYISEKVLGGVAVDALFLEYDTPRAGSFAPLAHVAPDKTVVLGLVSTKTGELESVDTLKRRIDEAARYIPLERLCLSPQCGFASRDKGNPIALDDQKRKLERVVTVARDVWG
ncbi:MAG TPA: 5-methyltetrahydropteroyltriglutamate--homocysteine S-methyltransferase [Stellaceae bacterium]|nr:5-methyltetrahydropteroyltriglutamate--homocysteine S-methyltransferase [Stellaceae bacterium]